MKSNKFKVEIFNELKHENPDEEFKIKKRYFETYHCRFSSINKFGVFTNEKVKVITENQLNKLYKSPFIMKWVCCNDIRTIDDPHCCGYHPDTKNRDACAKWRAKNADKWTILNKTRAQTKRDIAKHKKKMAEVFKELKEL